MEAKIFVQPELMLPAGERVHENLKSRQVGRKQLAMLQKSDPFLIACFAAAIDKDSLPEFGVAFYWDNEVLMRRWKKNDTFYQIVIPSVYRAQILQFAHDHVLPSHLGIRKTYERVLRYFFCLGVKSDVSTYCRSCHVYQLTSKPNQRIQPAPLHPIPALGEPFEHIIMYCVGPLPKSKARNQYIILYGQI